MIRLPAIFSHGAILQRRKPCAFWGWSNETNFIEVTVEGFRPSVTLSSSLTGYFKLYLPPVEGPGPYTITVKNLDTGEECLLKDILFGEVYLGSGQSNMEFVMEKSPVQLEDSKRANTPEKSDFIRFFNVKKNFVGVAQDDCQGDWKISSNENLPLCSAVGYHFADSLYKELKVPIGIVNSSCGGSKIEPWISLPALRKNPLTKESANERFYTFHEPDKWNEDLLSNVCDEDYIEKHCIKDPGNSGVAGGFADPLLDDSSWKDMEVPGDWILWNIGGHGACWFRKKVTIPPHWAGKELNFHFCIADKHDIVYFNGEEIGRTGKEFEYFGEKRKYTIPAHLVKEGVNQISIRVYSFIFGAGFYGSAKHCFLAPAGENAPEETLSTAGAWKAQMELSIPEVAPGKTDINAPGNHQTCGTLFNGMIHPVCPYGLAGVLWYQGETSAGGGIQKSREYASLLTSLIEDWREKFEQESLPFFVVSLAGFKEMTEYAPTNNWPYLRESQRRVAGALPNVSIAAAHDLGEEEDIHPKNKRSVGERLARQALYRLYGKKESLPSGPDFLRMQREGETLRLTFDFAKGLHTADGKEIKGFYIAGTNGIYSPAEGKIEGEELILSSKEVKEPFFVRYAWSDFPVTNLVNEAGLPVHPFEA